MIACLRNRRNNRRDDQGSSKVYESNHTLFAAASLTSKRSGHSLRKTIGPDCVPNRSKGSSVPEGHNVDASPVNSHISPAQLLGHRPVALLSLLPRPAVLFTAGAIAGAIGKTVTAPLDRVKILLQVRGGNYGGLVQAAAHKGQLIKSFVAIGRTEGFSGYWKGNLPQVLRVLPYSAVQLYSYEFFKRAFRRKDGELSMGVRLMAGACAGMTSTLVTYPLDTLRLRLAVDPKTRSMTAATALLWRQGGTSAFFRGLVPAIVGIAPYMALELAAFDLLPPHLPPFARGFSAALIATSCCYPLDTIRRHVQMSSTVSVPLQSVIADILRQEGLRGMYRGFIPNALKNLPNKGIRLSTFDAAKRLLNHAESAYEEELAAQRTQHPRHTCGSTDNNHKREIAAIPA